MELRKLQKISIVFAFAFVSAHCMDKCIMKEERFMYPPLYTMADKPLPSVAIAFILIPMLEFDGCFVDVVDVMAAYQFSNTTPSFAAFSFVCILPVTIDFRCSEESKCMYGDMVVGNFEIMTCKTTLESIDYFSRYFRLLSFYLYEMELIVTPTESLPEPENSQCLGLRRANTIVIALLKNLTYSDFLSIFQCSGTLPEVDTLVISDIPWRVITDDIVGIFPNLQSLELQNVGLEHPPSFFPWNKEPGSLPLNLSRTEYLQNLYASTLFLDIPENEPRRILNLRYNSIGNLTGYRFFGRLHMITLENNGISEIEPSLLSDVKDLQNLDLAANEISEIPEGFFDSHTTLRSLTLRNNKIHRLLNNTFHGLTLMQFLDLSYNRLAYIPEDLFSSMLSLKLLCLENNLIKKIEPSAFPIISKQLERINLDGNPLKDIPVAVFYISSLEKVSLKYTEVTFQNFTAFLQSIHVNLLSQNVLAYDPDRKAASTRKIDLTGSKVAYFKIDEDQFDEDSRKALILLLRYFTFALKDNPIRCDCNIAPLSNFVRNLTAQKTLSSESYIYHDWKCVWPPEFQGREMLNINPENTYCTCCNGKLGKCPQNCTCYIRYENDAIIVDCRNLSYTSLPVDMPRTLKLDLWFQNNNVSEIQQRNYFSRVRQLRLSNNNIEKISAASVDRLRQMEELWLDSNHLSYLPSNMQDRQLKGAKLQDNPYICDCNNLWFKRWIKKNTDVIDDWQEVTCGSESETGRRIVDASDDEFVCATDNTLMIAATASGCSLFLIVIVCLIMIYKFEIQVLLYMWFGIRPFDRVKYKKAEKIDVIIIHNLDITDWINEKLLRFLESMCRLRVCEIDRDFVAGYSFNENISHLASQSKRMLIVLSPSVLVTDDLVRMSLNEGNIKVRDSRLNFYIFVCHQISSKQIKNKCIKKQMKRSKVISSDSKLFLEKLLYLMPRKKNIEDLKINIELESLSISYCHQTLSSNVFDVFILYGEEYQVVFRELVPRFESTGYTLCLPDREFVLGSSKQANIIGAIKHSRHTLIVLTEDNINDEWLVFGFQNAMEKNLQERYNHLIILTDNKIDPNDLQTEMKNYVSSHVILYLDESSLWDKIYRSMPLKTRCRW